MKARAIHINDVCRLMDKARIDAAAVNIKAWDSDGGIIEYNGWYVIGGYWRGGFHRIRNAVSKEIRTVPDVFIFEFNGKSVYL